MSIVQKNKNTFNLIAKRLKDQCDVRMPVMSYNVNTTTDYYEYRFSLYLRVAAEKIEIVEQGSKVYFCMKPVLKQYDEGKKNVCAQALRWLTTGSSNSAYHYESKEAQDNLIKDGIVKSDKGMRDLDVITSKAYKKLIKCIDEVYSQQYNKEPKLIDNVYKGFTRRDLLPLLVYYGNTDEISYVYERRWASLPENISKSTRTRLSKLVSNESSLRNVIRTTVCESPIDEWLDIDVKQGLDEYIKRFYKS